MNEWQEQVVSEKGVDMALWKRLFGYARRYPRVLRPFLLGGLGVAVVDVAFPLVTRALLDDIDGAASRGELASVRFGPYIGVYAALTAGLCLGVWLFIVNGGRLRTAIAHDIREDAFANLQELSFAFYDQRPVGWLVARMTSDCERLSNILAWGFLDYGLGHHA